jgi:hypothetical protein
VRWRGIMQPKESSCRQTAKRRSLWIGCCYPHLQMPGSHVYVQLCSSATHVSQCSGETGLGRVARQAIL